LAAVTGLFSAAAGYFIFGLGCLLALPLFFGAARKDRKLLIAVGAFLLTVVLLPITVTASLKWPVYHDIGFLAVSLVLAGNAVSIIVLDFALVRSFLQV